MHSVAVGSFLNACCVVGEGQQDITAYSAEYPDEVLRIEQKGFRIFMVQGLCYLNSKVTYENVVNTILPHCDDIRLTNLKPSEEDLSESDIIRADCGHNRSRPGILNCVIH